MQVGKEKRKEKFMLLLFTCLVGMKRRKWSYIVIYKRYS